MQNLLLKRPIIVSDPEGCERKLSIRHFISRLHDEFELTLNETVLHYNARTSSKDVLQKLRQFCSINTGTSGRIYRPKKGRRLVFYTKDINLTSPDKYNASEIVMFLSQVAIHNGFYDDDLEFQCGDVPGENPVKTFQCVRHEVALCLLKCQEHRVLQKRYSSRAMSRTHATQNTSLVHFATLTREFTRTCLFDVPFSQIDVVRLPRPCGALPLAHSASRSNVAVVYGKSVTYTCDLGDTINPKTCHQQLLRCCPRRTISSQCA